MKRVGRILVVALFASAVWTSAATAEPRFFLVTIDIVGMETPTLLKLRLTDTLGAFTEKDFINTSAVTNQLLAIALTAFALNSAIWVHTDPETGGPVPEINLLFIQK
jgi:hypothetical protein